MNQRFTTDEIQAIDQFLDLSQKVIFWVDVVDDGFVFRKFSKYYIESTQFDLPALVGKQPHEVLPARLADTIVKNYTICRDSAKPYVYEELLELAEGAHWWNTSLSPILNDEGQVVSIVGIAEDITSWKESDVQASLVRTRVSALTGQLHQFARDAVDDVRGPCVGLLAMMNIVTRDFQDLGDGKLQLLRQCENLVQELMKKIDGLKSDARQITDIRIDGKVVDLGHLCADLCALVDPHKDYEILFPVMTIETDMNALQTVLRKFVENAKVFSRGRIEIEASDYGDGQIYFSIFDDGIGRNPDFRPDGSVLLPAEDSADGGVGIATACSIVTGLGGSVEAGPSEDGTTVEMSFSLPGRIVDVTMQALASIQDVDTTPGVAHRLRLVG